MKNEAPNISRCLESIKLLDTTGFIVEIIVIDNGSTDESVDIAKKYDVNVLIKIGGNISSLRNFGASLANGSIFAFLDADCAVKSDWLINAVKYFNDNNIGAVGCTPGAPQDGTWVETTWSKFRTRKKGTKKVKWINSSNFIVRKDVFNELNGFSEALETGEDVDICYRISNKYEIISDQSLQVTHYGEPNNIVSFFKKEKWRGKNNIKGLINHGFDREEFRSLAIPAYYLAIILLIPVSISENNFIIIIAILFLAPIILFFIKYSYLEDSLILKIKLTSLFIVYALARAFALFAEIFSIFKNKLFQQRA